MQDKILKDITSGQEAKDHLLRGVDALANVVGSTMGFRGRTVLIESMFGMPEPTKDGYKTLQSIFLEHPVEAMACEVAKQASQRTVDFAGDSTSATIVLLQAFFRNSLEALKNGKSAIDIKNDIEKSVDLIVKYLDSISVMEITDKIIYDVALTSANGEVEIAKIVQEAFIKVGEHGSVTHLRSNNEETHLDFIDGTLVESGYATEHCINNLADRTAEFHNPLIVCSNIVFKTFRQVQPFLEFALRPEVNQPIILIGDWQDSACWQVRDVINQNIMGGKLQCAMVNAPSFGNKRRDFLTDLATLCGTQLLSSLSGDDFKGRETQFLGACKKAIIGKSDTIISPIENEEIKVVVDSKIAEIESQIEVSKNPLEKKYLNDRLSKLHGGVSIIKVGSIIESELQEKIDRVEDAICAVRSAKEEGVLGGGGIALISAIENLTLDKISAKSIKSPFEKILKNAGMLKDNRTWLDKLLGLKGKSEIIIEDFNYPIGYDVKNFKQVDMFDAGILDATKAIKHALINSASASNTLLLTDNIVTNSRMTTQRQ